MVITIHSFLVHITWSLLSLFVGSCCPHTSIYCSVRTDQGSVLHDNGGFWMTNITRVQKQNGAKWSVITWPWSLDQLTGGKSPNHHPTTSYNMLYTSSPLNPPPPPTAINLLTLTPQWACNSVALSSQMSVSVDLLLYIICLFTYPSSLNSLESTLLMTYR